MNRFESQNTDLLLGFGMSTTEIIDHTSGIRSVIKAVGRSSWSMCYSSDRSSRGAEALL